MTVAQTILLACLAIGGENNVSKYTWENYQACVKKMRECVGNVFSGGETKLADCVEKTGFYEIIRPKK